MGSLTQLVIVPISTRPRGLGIPGRERFRLILNPLDFVFFYPVILLASRAYAHALDAAQVDEISKRVRAISSVRRPPAAAAEKR